MNEKDNLRSLRLQNQHLLDKLKHGQRECRVAINSLQGQILTELGNHSNCLQNLDTSSPTVVDFNNQSKEYAACQLLKAKQHELRETNNFSKVLTHTKTNTTSTCPRFSVDENSFCDNASQRLTPPKSILKRRKIIDDNVKVHSKYLHTPVHRDKTKQLNFSYSDVDDLQIAKWHLERETNKNNAVKINATNDKGEDVLCKKTNRYCEQNLDDDIKELMKQKLLIDSGNDRKNASIVQALAVRPPSILYDANGDKSSKKDSSMMNTSMQEKSKSLETSITKEMARLLENRQDKQPLLGYDWIAGILDNGPSLVNKSEDYFNDIKEFRRQNRDECVGTASLRNALDLSKTSCPPVSNTNHKCVHGFIINERLFPQAMNPDGDGNSVCPVCLATRPEPTMEDPGFVRVSIPRSSLLSPYKVRPRRRRSFDDTDSIALSNHCIAGWENTKPSMMPTASNLDLKGTANGVKAHLIETEQELEKLAQSFNETSRTLHQLQNKSRLNSTVNSLQEQIRQTTEELLNTSHSLRYELQQMEKERDVGVRAPFSTAYPAF